MCAKKLTDNTKATKEASETKAKTPTAPSAGKKKLVVSYKNLTPEVLELVKEKYPKGYSDYLIKVNKGDGQFFYAITLDTEAVDYLIKVDVKIDSEIEEVEKALFDQPDDIGGGDDDFPDDAGSFEDEEE